MKHSRKEQRALTRRIGAGRALVALCSVACACSWAPPARADPAASLDRELQSDPRVLEANALLSDATARDRAVQLYRAVLADDPSDGVARMWLARVLSWDGDYEEALAEYRQIALRESDPVWARKEVANVLSWAGRYPEAYASYLQLLELQPRDFDLNLALAHAYAWGGRSADAKRAYRRTLEIRDDVAVRSELEQLEHSSSSESASLQGQGQFARDSDDFEIWQQLTTARYPLGDASRLEARLGYTRIAADPRELGARDLYQSLDWAFALHHSPTPPLSLQVELGARHWDHAEDRLQFRGRADYGLGANTALAATIEHGDYLDASASLEAVRRGLSYTSVAASLWQALGPAASFFGEFTTSFVSDGNESLALYLDASARPWPSHSPEFSLSVNFISYTGESDHYYDPDVDVGTTLSARARYPETGNLYARAAMAVGFGYAKQDAVGGSGFTYRAELGARVEAWGWWFDVSGHRAESQRSSVYTIHGALALLGRSF